MASAIYATKAGHYPLVMLDNIMKHRSKTCFQKGHVPWNKGKHGVQFFSEEQKRVLRTVNIGKSFSNEHRQRLRDSNLGKKRSEETRKRISISKSGERHPRWKGGISSENTKIRNSREFRLWRMGVLARDSGRCVLCEKSAVMLHADHIKPFSLFPELRFEISNGRTLCVDCHRKTDTWGGRTLKLMHSLTG